MPVDELSRRASDGPITAIYRDRAPNEDACTEKVRLKNAISADTEQMKRHAQRLSAHPSFERNPILGLIICRTACVGHSDRSFTGFVANTRLFLAVH